MKFIHSFLINQIKLFIGGDTFYLKSMQLIISKNEKTLSLPGSSQLVNNTFFTDDLVKPGSYISLKPSNDDSLNAVCCGCCDSNINEDDKFILVLCDKARLVQQSREPQPRFRVVSYMQQYLSGKLDWLDDLEWNKLAC